MNNSKILNYSGHILLRGARIFSNGINITGR